MQSMAFKHNNPPFNKTLNLKLPIPRVFGILHGLIWVKYGSI